MKKHPNYDQFSERSKAFIEMCTEPAQFEPLPPATIGGCQSDHHIFAGNDDGTIAERCVCGAVAYAERQRDVDALRGRHYGLYGRR